MTPAVLGRRAGSPWRPAHGCRSRWINASHGRVLLAGLHPGMRFDADDDMFRIDVRDDDASLPGSGRVVSFELREASTAV